MPLTILTYLKAMSKLLDIPKFYGPLATVAFTVAYHLAAVYFGFSVNLIWLIVFLVAGSFIGGLWAGLLCAVWVNIYAWYAIPDDPARIIQIWLGTLIMAGTIGLLRQRERRLQDLTRLMFANGNVTKMRDALARTTEMKLNLPTYSEMDLQAGLEQVESDLGNTLAVIDGYKYLREEIERVNQWYASPANVKRLQEMRDSDPPRGDTEAYG